VAAARPGELDLIPGTPVMWAELRWAARAEGVAHLDDLLLRRVRLGLLLPGGGAAELPRIRAICQGELSWDDERWQAEEERYLRLWRTHYGLPEHAAIPDWRVLLAEARDRRAERRARRRRVRRREVAAAVATLAMGMLGLGLRRRIRETVA
jgi:glycerol-3-phosphate dehydrogenase